MATSIGALSILLSANTNTLKSDLTRGMGMVGDFSKKLAGALTSPGGAIAGGLGAAGIVESFQKIKPLLDNVSHLGKAADKFGIPVETFSILAYGARTANVDIEDLEKGIGKFQKAMGGAAASATGNSAAFVQLGLSGSELAHMPLEQALALVGERLKQLPTAAERAKATLDLFGKGSLDLNRVLGQGSEGFAKWKKEAEAMGLAISEQDVAAVRAFNRTLKDMQLRAEGFATQLTIQLAPLFTGIVKTWDDALAKFGGPKGLLNAKNALKFVAPVASPLIDYLYEIGEAEEKRKGPAPDVQQGLIDAEQAKQVAEFTEKLQSQANTFGLGANQAEIYRLGLQLVKPEMLAGAKAAAAMLEELERINSLTVAGGTIFDVYNAKTTGFVDSFKRGKISVDAAASALTNLNKEMEKSITHSVQELTSQSKSPVDELRDRIEYLRKLQGFGLPKDVFDKQSGEAFEKLRKGLNLQPPSAGGVAEEGSREAGAAIAKFLNKGDEKSAQDRVRLTLEAAKEIAKQQLDEMKKISAALQGSDVLNLP